MNDNPKGTQMSGVINPYALAEVITGQPIAWQRLYMEPVEKDSPTIDEAVRQLSTPST